MSYITRIFILFYLSLASLGAAPFDDGLEAYHQSEYAKATESFEQALEAGESAAIRHNLALSHFQNGEVAEATWQLERAVRLDPINESYLFKLGALRQQLGLYEAPINWWQSASLVLAQNTWTWIAAISFWCLFAAIVIPRLGAFTRPIFLKLIICLCLTSLSLSVAALGIRYTQNASGIVVAKENAPLHHAPASAAPETGIARPGERARVLDMHEDYLKVETEAGIRGWIMAKAFRKL